MKNTIIDKFLRKYEPKKNTVNSYRMQLNNFFNYLKIEADEYLNNHRDYQKDIKEYMIELGKKPPYTRNLGITAIKMFLMDNLKDFDNILPPTFWFRLRTGKNKGARAVTLDKTPTPDELKHLLQYANLSGKALFMTLATSGMRVNELLSLTWDDIKLHKKPCSIEIPANITKSGQPRITFVTDETREVLKAWKREHKDYLAKHKVGGKNNYKKFIKDQNDNHVFPFTYQNSWFMWERLIKKANLDSIDKTTGRYQYHIHALRKFFRTRLPKVIGVDITEFLMGHENYLTREYRHYPEDEIAKEYQKGMDRLLIFEKEADTSDLREEMIEKEKQIQELLEWKKITEMKLDILELKYQNEKQKNGK